MACGKTTKEDEIKLQIDHIIPLSKGGTDEEENLQALCHECNLGKSNFLYKTETKIKDSKLSGELK